MKFAFDRVVASLLALYNANDGVSTFSERQRIRLRAESRLARSVVLKEIAVAEYDIALTTAQVSMYVCTYDAHVVVIYLEGMWHCAHRSALQPLLSLQSSCHSLLLTTVGLLHCILRCCICW